MGMGMVDGVLKLMPNANNKIVENIKIPYLSGLSFPLIIVGIKAIDSPAINAVLQITLPAALPILRPKLPLAAEIVDTRSSGKVVAIETIVAPTIIDGIFVFLPKSMAEETNQLPPIISKAMPTAKRITLKIIL